MRIILLLFISLLVQYSATAQTPMPSQKEMQEQMQQAKRDAAQLTADLEKQIAVAKLNKEDPSAIKQLEDQLATMKKMLGLMDQTGTIRTDRPKTLPGSKTILPHYESPIVRIFLKEPVTAPTAAQSKDSMFWYRGRRLNDSMLVTTQRTVVLYSRRRNMLVVQPDRRRDSLFHDIDSNLSRSGIWNNQFIDGLAVDPNCFFQYPQTLITLNDFRFINESYIEILRNTIDLPIQQNPGPGIPGARHNGPAATEQAGIYFTDPITTLQAMHRDMMSHMNLTLPWDASNAPAVTNRACDLCDTLSQRNHYLKRKQWRTKLLENEMQLLGKMAAIRKWMMTETIATSESGIPTLGADLQNAIIHAFRNLDMKVARLEQLYGDDIRRMELVIETMLFIESQRKNYSGIVDDSYSARIRNRMDNYIRLLVKDVTDAMAAFEYAKVLNTSIIHRFERHQKLLGKMLGGTGQSTALKDLAEKIKSFNRFELEYNGRFEVEQLRSDDSKAVEIDGRFRTNQKIYVSLGRSSYNCNWQLYLTNTDHTKPGEEEFRIPLEAEGGIKRSYVDNPPRVITKTYTGPAEMLMVFPYITLNLCNFPKDDTAIVDVLRYKTDNLSQYQPGIDQYSVDFLQYVNKMVISAEESYNNADNLVSTAFDMLNASLQAVVDRATGYSKLDQMQVDFKMNGVQRKHQQMLSEITHFPDKLIRNHATRDTPLLFNGSLILSNKELEQKYNLKTGVIAMSVTHAPQ